MSIFDLTSVLVTLRDACLIAAAAGCVVMLIQATSVLAFRGAQPGRAAAEQPVTILKPLHGVEPGLAMRLASFCEQDYTGAAQILIGTQDEAAAIGDIAYEIKTQFPDRTIELVVDARDHGSNRKVSNLVNMMSHARYDTIVLSDSDIVAGPEYLRNIMSLLAPPRVGVVTCLYYGMGEGLWSRLSALAINSHFLPGAILGERLRLAQYCCGATMAMRRSMLERIGGFAAFADVLADDYAIGAAVRSLGYDIATAPFLVGHRCFETSLREFVQHQMRVARTIRNIEPLGYIGTIVNHPWPLALIAMASGSSIATLVAVAALASRLALCRCVERRFKLPRQNYGLVPLHDIIVFAVYIASFFGTTVRWQNSDYRVTADGTLIEHRG